MNPIYTATLQHPAIGAQQVMLLGIENAQIITEREPNEVFYRSKLSGTFKLKNGNGMLNGFSHLYTVLTDADKCEKITATISQLCPDDTLQTLFTGRVSAKEVCADRCKATLTIEQDDIYTCVFDNWEKKTNHYAVPSVTASSLDADSVIEEYVCNSPQQIFIPIPAFPNYFYYVCPHILEQSGLSPAQAAAFAGLNVPLQTLAYTVKWCIKSTTDILGAGNQFVTITTRWWREVKTVPSATVLPSPWALLDDNGTTARYWRCPFSAGGQVIEMDNGRRLNDVLEFTVSDALSGCGVCQVVSGFLGINSTGVTLSNDAYDNAFRVQNLLVYQQSDVKRFNAIENAGDGGNTEQFVWSLKEMLEFLKNTLNCYWLIEETNDPFCPYIFRVEHISYFTTQGTVNLTTEFARNCYTYQNDNAPQTEEFNWRAKTSNPVIMGKPITYASACTSGKRSYDAGVNTDVQYIANPNNVDKVPDEGFVIVATDYIDSIGNYIINVERGEVTGITALNAAMGWENLHHRYWKHNRSLLQGNMNNQPTTFITAKPTILADDIRKKLCCGSTINPYATYLTKVGLQSHISALGRLKRVTLNLKSRTLIYQVEHSYA